MAEQVVCFSQSARKHRIGKTHVLHVIANQDPVSVQQVGRHAPRMLLVGKDSRGLELEIVALDLSEYLLVIHAMPRAFRRSQ